MTRHIWAEKGTLTTLYYLNLCLSVEELPRTSLSHPTKPRIAEAIKNKVLIAEIKGHPGPVLSSGCLPPQNILHGDHNKRDEEFFSVDQEVSYSCEPGYTLIGTNLVRCTSLGTWSHAAPACEGA